MTLREFGRVVRSGWYLVLLAIVLVLGGAYVYLDRQVSMFDAVTRIELQDTVAAELGATASADPEGEGDFTANLRSSAVVEAAATILDSPAPPRVLASMVSAEQFGPVVDVTAAGYTPEQAMATADAFARAYIDYLAGHRTTEIEHLQERQEELSEQLVDVSDRLVDDEDDPLALAEQNLIVDEYTAHAVRLNALQTTPELAILTRPAESATLQGMPSHQVLALATLGGLVAGIGLAFTRRSLDQRIRVDSEVAELADTPVLAHIYGIRKATRKFRSTRLLPVTRRVATPFTESIRELRTAVAVAMPAKQHQVVVVTAVDAHGSRSFGTANLAASFALSGRCTVALAGDLRQPGFERLFMSDESADEADRHGEIANLSVQTLPAQQLDPADYLATAEVRERIEELRSMADVLVIDAPPALAAADATILGQYATGVVLVATAGKTDRTALTEAVDRLRSNQVPLLGIALVGVSRDRRILYASTYGSDELMGRMARLRRLLPVRGQKRRGHRSKQAGEDAAEAFTDRKAPDLEPHAKPWQSQSSQDRQATTRDAADTAPARDSVGSPAGGP